MKIFLISYDRLTKAIKKYISKSKYSHLEVYNCCFNNTIEYMEEFIQHNPNSVFISAGSNARIIENNYKHKIDHVKVRIDTLGILEIIYKAINKLNRNNILILTYKKKLKEIQKYSNLFSINIEAKSYSSMENLSKKIKTAKSNGINLIIGSSLVCDLAKKNDIDSKLIYSKSSIQNTINAAFKIKYSKQKLLKTKKLQDEILNKAYSGIILTNSSGNIEYINNMGEKIIDLNKNEILNKNISKFIDFENILFNSLKNGTDEKNLVKTINNKKVMLSISPLLFKDTVFRLVLTFLNLEDIKEAELISRKKNYKKRLYAKYKFNDILGSSETLQKTKDTAKIFAKTNYNILITGETGTGKELFAQSIHNASSRSNYPFVRTNCSALPQNLLEAELFGYKEGAFTGAKQKEKKGLFELAHKGTFFLDEVSELSMNLQPKLLRVLEENEIRKIGGEEFLKLDVRIIAATNKSLEEEVAKGNFREDLYYRLNQFDLIIPPLKNRKQDIEILIKNLIDNNESDFWIEIINYCKNKDWPGNVRQLINTIEKILLLKKKNIINNSTEAINVINNKTYNNSNNEEKEKLIRKLEDNNWIRTQTAESLDISRTTLWRKMTKYNLIEN